jgi:hypothetical protein
MDEDEDQKRDEGEERPKEEGGDTLSTI